MMVMNCWITYMVLSSFHRHLIQLDYYYYSYFID